MNYSEQIENLKCNVKQMLIERNKNFQQTDNQFPSPLWIEGLSVLDYVINLSAENFLNIRYHTGLFTGESTFKYWHQFPPLDPEKYAEDSNYTFYIKDIPEAYWIGEPPIPRIPKPIGVNYNGKIINNAIMRYQSCISNLYLMGILTQFLQRNNNNIIVEIGGGHGGLAHVLGAILGQKSTYIILDLPEMLLFSGGYLIVNNPQANIYVYGKNSFTPEFLKSQIYDYDFVLLPNYVLEELYVLPEIDLMVNLSSFQEMTREQLNQYIEFAYSKLSGYFYSDNFDRHPFNDKLAPDTVTTMLADRFYLFPPPGLYEKQVRYNPWLSKFYFGISKDKNNRFPEKASMKFSSGKNKFVFNNNVAPTTIQKKRYRVSI